MASSEEDRDILLAIYHEIYGEIAKLRDSEFRAAFLSLALDAGLIAVFSNAKVVASVGAPERWIGSIASSFVVLVLILYLLKIHYYLNQHRTIRRRIEQALKVHTQGQYAKEALFPPEWNNPQVGFKFQFIGVILPLISLMVLFQAGTVFLIWKVTS